MVDIVLKRKPASPSFTDLDSGEDVYDVYGSYGTKQFRVPKDTPVTVEDDRFRGHESSDPRRTLPNMEVKDGAMVIPLCDIVEQIVSRSEPVDLAKALWEDDDVKAEFIYCAAERYSEGCVDDGDRRELLRQLQSTIHSAALDKLASAVSGVEHRARDFWMSQRDRSDYARFYYDILCELEQRFPDAHARIVERFGTKACQHSPEEYDEFKIGGAHWNETRDRWRKYVESYFPYPEAFVKERREDDV